MNAEVRTFHLRLLSSLSLLTLYKPRRAFFSHSRSLRYSITRSVRSEFVSLRVEPVRVEPSCLCVLSSLRPVLSVFSYILCVAFRSGTLTPASPSRPLLAARRGNPQADNEARWAGTVDAKVRTFHLRVLSSLSLLTLYESRRAFLFCVLSPLRYSITRSVRIEFVSLRVESLKVEPSCLCVLSSLRPSLSVFSYILCVAFGSGTLTPASPSRPLL